MSALDCLVDTMTHGDKVISALSMMLVNSLKGARLGELVSCSEYGANSITQQDSAAFYNRLSVVVNNGLCECGYRNVSFRTDSIIES